MKICPKCNTQYSDDTLQFCLQDGAQLPELSAPRSQFETVELDEPETVIARKKTDKITVDLSQPEVKTRESDRSAKRSVENVYAKSEPKTSKTWIAVLLTAVGMLVLFGFGGTGAWFYFGGGRTTIADKPESNSVKTNSTDQDVKKDQTDNKKSKSTTPKPRATAKIDSAKIAKEVGKQISSWKSFAEARNLKSYMGKYASRVDYYNKRRASRSFVESDKKKAFSEYTSIKSKFTKINIKPSKDGKTATATFDKEWDFSGPKKSTSGKVRSRLIFRKTGDKWLIVSEKDLKVYYVNKS